MWNKVGRTEKVKHFVQSEDNLQKDQAISSNLSLSNGKRCKTFFFKWAGISGI